MKRKGFVRSALSYVSALGAAALAVSAATSVQAQTPPGATVTKVVQVPAGMQSAPFDQQRSLVVPSGYDIAVYARVPNARFMAIAPTGELLVSQPGQGKVLIIRKNGTGDPIVSEFASGLQNPHDIVFHTLNGTTWVYIAESHQINRYKYSPGDLTAQNRQIIISGLPDSSLPELQGAYGHQLKNIALNGNTLYLSIASATNSDPSDLAATPKRGAIYVYNADGTNGRLFAQGLRNAEGLAILPGTNTLWVTVNNRDNLRYPYNDGTTYNGSAAYGQIIPSYVDNHPPEEFTSVRDGGHYGWPFANPNPDTANGYNNMPFDPDYDNNPGGSLYDVSLFDRISKGIQAHSAPLGFIFNHYTSFGEPYRTGATLAYHGSWNRTQKTGYKITYFPWTASGPGEQVDLVKGWLNDAAQTSWGRPVDVVVDHNGAMFISDDASGTIYKMTPTAAPTQAVNSFTLYNADSDTVVPGFSTIVNGATINFSSIGTQNLSIRANTNPGTVGSVRFVLDATPAFKIENAAPYTIAGENGTDYLPWTPSLGQHTLTAIPYSGANLTGVAGTPLTITFNVVNGTNPNLVSNGGFESEQYSTGTPSGWSTWGGSAGTDANADYTEAGGSLTPHSGNYNAAHWKASNYEVYTYQTKTGLTNGVYTLRAWVRSSGGQSNRTGGKAIMLAKNFGGAEKNINLVNAGNNWVQVTVSDINVANGQCEIGFYSYAAGGTWITFDDVEFFKQ